ncbi:MAG: hypothetical protein AAFZ04_00800 [Pseudomonadota bacterium]
MLRTLVFVLPVLIPSWRFFKSIEPSPRVEWAPVPAGGTANTTPAAWQEFRPRPTRLSAFTMIRRLVWSPDRNEDLFLISCAERIHAAPTDHSIDAIRRCIQSDASKGLIHPSSDRLIFRLTFVHREGSQLVQEVIFQSDPFPAGQS